MIAKSHNYVSRNAMRRKRESASRRGRYGNQVKAAKRMAEGPTWRVCMVVRFGWPDGRRHRLVVSATEDPSAPLGLSVDGKWSKLASERTLRSLIAKRIFLEIAPCRFL
jgi:hypothetical protein